VVGQLLFRNKKQKGRKDWKKMAEKTSPRAPVSVLIGRQLDQEKIDVLSKRVQVCDFFLLSNL
jgi:hypothetical protein